MPRVASTFCTSSTIAGLPQSIACAFSGVSGKPTRVGFKMLGDRKVRFAKRSGVEIDG